MHSLTETYSLGKLGVAIQRAVACGRTRTWGEQNLDRAFPLS
jgi:hypothetical protein